MFLLTYSPKYGLQGLILNHTVFGNIFQDHKKIDDTRYSPRRTVLRRRFVHWIDQQRI